MWLASRYDQLNETLRQSVSPFFDRRMISHFHILFSISIFLSISFLFVLVLFLFCKYARYFVFYDFPNVLMDISQNTRLH